MKNFSITLLLIFVSNFIIAQQTETNTTDFNFENGISFSFDDGSYEFNINGFIKPSYSYADFTQNVDGGVINEVSRQFKSKNSVLRFNGKADKEKVSFGIVLDYSVSDPLMEAWISYHPSTSTIISFGQKRSFINSREMILSEDNLQFTDRGMLSYSHNFNHYGQEFGVFIESKFGNTFGISPKIAVTSGDGRNSFGVDSRDSDLGGVKLGGRLDLYPFGYFKSGNESISDLMKEDKLKLEFGIAYGNNSGVSHPTGNGHGDFLFYDQLGENNLADYEELFFNLLLKYKGFSILGEYVDAAASGLNETYSDIDPIQILIPNQISEFLVLGDSYNMQMGYVFSNKISIDFRYEFSEPEFENETSLLQDYENYTIGLTKFFDDNNLKLQLAVSNTTFAYGNESTNAELVFQIAF